MSVKSKTSSVPRVSAKNTSKPAVVGTENADAFLDLDGSNALVTRRLFGSGFDEVLARPSAAGTVSYDLTDRQGSVRGLVDNSGTVGSELRER